MMKLVVVVSCFALFCSCVLSLERKERPSTRSPNILLIMADQMRADMLSSAGNSEAITPNLDRLAAEGVRYRNAFSSTPTCTPARAALLTGLSPWYHGMLGYGSIAHSYPYEMPRALRDAGYYTSSIGKDHFGWNKTTNSGVAHGYDETNLYDGLPNEFDDYDEWVKMNYPKVDPMATGLEYNDYRGAVYALPEYLHPTAWVGRAAVSFLESYNMSKPFFLKVSFHRPHSPYDPPKRWMDRFDPSKMPSAYIGDWASVYAINYRNSTAPPGIWAGDVGEKQVGLSRQAYYASVGFVDEWIGEIMDQLNKSGMANNTFILFAADHGDMMGDHYHWRKGYPYFGSANVPMILNWPASMSAESGGPITVPRGSTLDFVTELRDVFPTFLDIANIPVRSGLNGSSLLKTLQSSTGSKVQWREAVDLEHDICYNATNHWNALTDGHWKYVFQAFDGSEQLFNLDLDPHELTNVAESEKEELGKWREMMVRQFTQEERGESWVQNGKLMNRVKGQLYSPHYPH